MTANRTKYKYTPNRNNTDKDSDIVNQSSCSSEELDQIEELRGQAKDSYIVSSTDQEEFFFKMF